MTSKRSWKGYNPVPRINGGPQGGVLGNMTPPSQGAIAPGKTREAPRRTDGAGGAFAGSGVVSLPVTLGAVAWWDGTQGKTLSGADVTAWEDQIGGVVVSPDEGANPADAVDGVTFTVGDRLATTSAGFDFLHNGAGGSLWLRLTYNLTANCNTVGAGLASSSGPGMYLFRVSTGTLAWRIVDSAGTLLTQVTSGGAFPTGAQRDTAASLSGSQLFAWIGTTALGPAAASGLSASAAPGFAIGSTYAATNDDARATIHQVLVFDRVLTNQDILDLSTWTP